MVVIIELMGRPRNTSAKTAVAIVPSVETEEEKLPNTADRVNNVSQKERAAFKVGLTREKILVEIKNGLMATKKSVELVDGEQVASDEPDMVMRLKAAELGAKYFGDMKEQTVQTGSVVNKVTYSWGPVTVVKNDVVVLP